MTEPLNFETIVTPVEREAQWRGTYRVYFNASEEAPKVWSIDDGDILHEVKVEEVYIYTSAASRFVPGDAEPKAWLEGYGTVVVANGVCIIEDQAIPIVRNPNQHTL